LPAKKVESVRQKQTSKGSVVRLLHTKPFIDDKWIVGFDRDKLKEWLVVRYSAEQDKFLPIWKVYKGKKVQWWDSDTHEQIKSGIKGYSSSWSREKKDSLKIDFARKKVPAVYKEFYHFDSFSEAQDKYIELCKKEGEVVEKLTVGDDGGDD